MAKKGFKVNKAGFNELRNSAEVVAILQEKAGSIKMRAESMAGAEFESEVRAYPTRSVGFVRATSFKAMKACRDKNVLIKAVG